MKRLFLLLAALPFVACTTTSNELNQNLEPLPAKAISYQCDSGNRIIVTYPDNETAEVKYMDDTYQMKIAISASGARYVGDGLVWWTKGNEASMYKAVNNTETGERIENCTQVLK